MSYMRFKTTAYEFAMKFLACFLMFWITSAELNDGHYYEIHHGCDTIYGHVLHTFGSVRSITECSLRCSEYDSCLSVQYSEVNKTCHLNKERYTTLSTDCTTMSDYAKIIRKTVRKLVNQNCSASSECSVDNSQCFLENCQCDPGYSYQYTTDSCLTSCDVYGSTFTLYPRYYIVNHNDRFLTGYAGEDCERACAEETAFVCRAVDFVPSKQQCQLSKATALTAQLKQDDGDPHDPHYHFHRNCQ